MSNKPPTDRFTRFTSTAPPSSSPTSSQSTANTSFTARAPSSQQPQTAPSPSSSPLSETPAEKVARLRAAHRATQRTTSLSATDRLISRGRTFADLAHRITTYSLLAITGISTVIAAYGLVSLVSHNRRQKRAWIEREMDRLHAAQQAFLRGEADAEQLHLLEQERAGEEIAKKFAEDKKRRKDEGVWGRLKGTFGSFTAGGDMGVESSSSSGRKGGVDGGLVSLSELVEAAEADKDKLLRQGQPEETVRPVAVSSSAGVIKGVGLDEKGRPVPMETAERAMRETRRVGEKEIAARTGIRGGPLDVLADNVVEKAQSTGSLWWGWLSGGGGGSGRSAPSSSS